MSVSEPLVPLQLPEDFGGRLTAFLGQFVSVYLMNVHAPSIISEPRLCPPYPTPPTPPTPPPPVTPSPGQGGAFGGPPLTPGIPPGGGHVTPIPMAAWCGPPQPEMKGTTIVIGTLAFVGTDYIVVRIALKDACQDVLIPFTAIGKVVPGRVV